jgi:hypothetical protein
MAHVVASTLAFKQMQVQHDLWVVADPANPESRVVFVSGCDLRQQLNFSAG